MSNNSIDWLVSVEELFGGTVNQQTLEEAAELMVSVSAVDLPYHKECVETLMSAIDAAKKGDIRVISAINKSGYQVNSTKEASEILEDLYQIYMKEFEKARVGRNLIAPDV
jgi:hypothetical protein